MIQQIKQIITDLGIVFRYGNPAQINEYLQHVDYSSTAGGVAAYCYLLTDTEYTNGKEGGNVAVFFSTLIDFDFDGQQALNATDICKAKAKDFLQKVAESNLVKYEGARFQYGYDDFAENVAWCAVRAYFEDMVPDCVTMPVPLIPPSEVYINIDMFSYSIEGNELYSFQIVFTDSPSVLPVSVEWTTDNQPELLYVTSLIWENEIEGYERFFGKVCYVVELLGEYVPGMSFTETVIVGDVRSNQIEIHID